MEGSEMGKRQRPLLRHRLDVEQGSNPSGCGRKTSAMDWKSIRKTLEAGIGEPASWFTGVALDADGKWVRWKQGRLSRDHSELLKPPRQETGGAWAGLVGLRP